MFVSGALCMCLSPVSYVFVLWFVCVDGALCCGLVPGPCDLCACAPSVCVDGWASLRRLVWQFEVWSVCAVPTRPPCVPLPSLSLLASAKTAAPSGNASNSTRRFLSSRGRPHCSARLLKRACRLDALALVAFFPLHLRLHPSCTADPLYSPKSKR